MRIRLKAINAALAERFPLRGYVLKRGRGYFYVSGGDSWRWPETSIMTPRLGCQSIESWVRDVEQLKQQDEARNA